MYNDVTKMSVEVPLKSTQYPAIFVKLRKGSMSEYRLICVYKEDIVCFVSNNNTNDM
jgi:hypothetical protein